MKRYSTTTSQYTNKPWQSVVLIIILFIDNLNIVIHISKKNKKRIWKILWFNSPFSTNVKMNIGKIFFKLLPKQSPKTKKLYRMLNKNTVKISYSCMRNMVSIISAHSQHLLSPNNSSFGCNCRNKSNCSLKEKCPTPKVIYQADMTNDIDDK